MTLGAAAPSPSQPRAAVPGGGGVALEDAAAKLSLGKDPIEKEGGEILDDILGGGGGGEARWPEDLSTASDQRHDAKRKGPLIEVIGTSNFEGGGGSAGFNI